MTRDQALRLLDVAREHRLDGAILLPLATGVRPGEVYGLLWKYVDLENKRIFVEHTVDSNNGHPELGAPKTESSSREVFLPPIVVEALAARRLLRVSEGHAALPYVGFHFHDLRHTFATHEIAEGKDLHALKEAMGHSSVKMTSDVYAHRDDPSYRAIATGRRLGFRETPSTDLWSTVVVSSVYKSPTLCYNRGESLTIQWFLKADARI